MWQRGNYNTIHQELFLETCNNNITEVHPIVNKQKKKIRNTRLVISEAWTGDQVKTECLLGPKDLCQRAYN